MAREGAQLIAPREENIRWREAVLKIDDRTFMRVQYLSDRRITDYGQLADLVAKGYDFGRAWKLTGSPDEAGRAYTSGSSSAVSLVRGAADNAEIISEKSTVRRATRGERTKYMEEFGERPAITPEEARAGAEALARAARPIGEAIVEGAEYIAGLVPTPTSRTRREREERLARARATRPAEVVAEPATGEEARPETAEVEAPITVEIPEEMTMAGTRSGTRTAYVTDVTTRTGARIDIEVEFDPSRVRVPFPEGRELRVASQVPLLLDLPQNRGAIVEVRFRERGKDWETVDARSAPTALGRFFHDFILKIATSPIQFVMRDKQTGEATNLHLFVDKARAEKLGIDYRTADFDTLVNSGVVIGFGTGPRGDVTVWYQRTIDQYLQGRASRDPELGLTRYSFRRA